VSKGNKRKKEERQRHKGYEYSDIDYTDRRYKPLAKQLYAEIRTNTIYKILIKNSLVSPEIKLIDVGCGTGIQLGQLSKKAFQLKSFGIDYSKKMLHHAIQILDRTEGSVYLIRGSAFELPIANESFDAIISTRFIHQYSNELKADLIFEMKRCLKPGGILIIEFYSIIPWLLRYPFKKRQPFRKYLKHCPTHNTVRRLIGQKYKKFPLMIPGSTKIEKIFGIKGLKSIRNLLIFFRCNLIFDEYLVFIQKGNSID
jgi:ubiquinone/menaquinone biosynthesis C-methylase UbiE